jgi:hypothetical protein
LHNHWKLLIQWQAFQRLFHLNLMPSHDLHAVI